MPAACKPTTALPKAPNKLQVTCHHDQEARTTLPPSRTCTQLTGCCLLSPQLFSNLRSFAPAALQLQPCGRLRAGQHACGRNDAGLSSGVCVHQQELGGQAVQESSSSQRKPSCMLEGRHCGTARQDCIQGQPWTPGAAAPVRHCWLQHGADAHAAVVHTHPGRAARQAGRPGQTWCATVWLAEPHSPAAVKEGNAPALAGERDGPPHAVHNPGAGMLGGRAEGQPDRSLLRRPQPSGLPGLPAGQPGCPHRS